MEHLCVMQKKNIHHYSLLEKRLYVVIKLTIFTSILANFELTCARGKSRYNYTHLRS